jgi:hypothetical protein
MEGRMISTRLLLAVVAAAVLIAACSPSAPSQAGATTPAAASVAASVTPPSASHATAASPVATPAVAAVCDKAEKAFDANHIDLTGPWAGDDDGIYYLRQVGSVLWWNGMSGRAGGPSGFGRDFNNVARAEIKALSIDVAWADVPRGGILGNGTLNLKIEKDTAGSVRIVKVSETGTGFGNTLWTPCKPG